MLQDLSHDQNMPSEADIRLWTHRDDNKDNATVHTMLDVPEEAEDPEFAENLEDAHALYRMIMGD